MKPSVGRIVHYRASEDTPACAAIITSVNEDETVSLRIFTPTGEFVAHEVAYSNIDGRPLHWTWPPRA